MGGNKVYAYRLMRVPRAYANAWHDQMIRVQESRIEPLQRKEGDRNKKNNYLKIKKEERLCRFVL